MKTFDFLKKVEEAFPVHWCGAGFEMFNRLITYDDHLILCVFVTNPADKYDQCYFNFTVNPDPAEMTEADADDLLRWIKEYVSRVDSFKERPNELFGTGGASNE